MPKYESLRFFRIGFIIISVHISHVILAVAQGCRFIIGHTDAGASDLDRAYRPSRTYPSARKTPYT